MRMAVSNGVKLLLPWNLTPVMFPFEAALAATIS
jgi:hypothetical protein